MADIQEQLNQAITAAKQGDRATARRLLQSVLLADKRNELAWLWLATVSNSAEDKRKCLERVLEINPANVTAQEALSKLGAPSRRAAVAAPTPDAQGRGLTTAVIGVAMILALIGLMFIVRNLWTNFNSGNNAEATRAVLIQTATAEQIALITTLSATPVPPTATPTLPARFVTLAAPTLPPTFTPTATATATETPLPTATGIPADAYTLLYSSLVTGEIYPRLYRVRADGAEEQALNVISPRMSISPDGRQIAFLSPPPSSETLSEDEIAEQGLLEIFIAPVNNLRNAQQLTRFGTGQLGVPSWSADGTQLLFVLDNTEIVGIDVQTYADTQDRIIYLSGTETGTKRTPSWSPDGTRILYAADENTPGFYEIFVYEPETQARTSLTDNVGTSLDPSWSPDGSLIAYVSDRSGDGDVYIMNADGSNKRIVTGADDGAEDMMPAWAADGQWLAFSSNRNNSSTFQVFIAKPDGSDVRQVTRDARNNLAPVFLP